MERGAVRWPGAAYRSGLRHVLNVSSDSELGFTQTGPAGSFETDLTQHSTIGLADDLIDAGDESVTMLALAEESNVGDLTVEHCTPTSSGSRRTTSRCRPNRSSIAPRGPRPGFQTPGRPSATAPDP